MSGPKNSFNTFETCHETTIEQTRHHIFFRLRLHVCSTEWKQKFDTSFLKITLKCWTNPCTSYVKSCHAIYICNSELLVCVLYICVYYAHWIICKLDKLYVGCMYIDKETFIWARLSNCTKLAFFLCVKSADIQLSFLCDLYKQLFWEGNKTLKNLPLALTLLSKNSYFAKTGGRLFQILWPSHNVLTLIMLKSALLTFF